MLLIIREYGLCTHIWLTLSVASHSYFILLLSQGARNSVQCTAVHITFFLLGFMFWRGFGIEGSECLMVLSGRSDMFAMSRRDSVNQTLLLNNGIHFWRYLKHFRFFWHVQQASKEVETTDWPKFFRFPKKIFNFAVHHIHLFSITVTCFGVILTQCM